MKPKSLTLIFFLLSFSDVATAKIGEWKWSRQNEVMRCYIAADLKARCEDYSYHEKHKLVLAQELEIEAIDSYGIKRKYGYGKAIEGPLCRQHLTYIKRLLSQTDQVCVTASDEYPILGDNVSYRWKALETKHGKLVW